MFGTFPESSREVLGHLKLKIEFFYLSQPRFPMEAMSTVYMYPTLHFFPYFLGVLVALFLLRKGYPKISGVSNLWKMI